LALIGGAQAEPFKADGEASGAISVAACGHAYRLKSPAGKAMMKLANAKFYENKGNTKDAAAFPVRCTDLFDSLLLTVLFCNN